MPTAEEYRADQEAGMNRRARWLVLRDHRLSRGYTLLDDAPLPKDRTRVPRISNPAGVRGSWFRPYPLFHEDGWVPYAPWWPFGPGGDYEFGEGGEHEGTYVPGEVNPAGYRVIQESAAPGVPLHLNHAPPSWHRAFLYVRNESAVEVTLTIYRGSSKLAWPTVAIAAGDTVRVGPSFYALTTGTAGVRFTCTPSADVTVRNALEDAEGVGVLPRDEPPAVALVEG